MLMQIVNKTCAHSLSLSQCVLSKAPKISNKTKTFTKLKAAFNAHTICLNNKWNFQKTHIRNAYARGSKSVASNGEDEIERHIKIKKRKTTFRIRSFFLLSHFFSVALFKRVNNDFPRSYSRIVLFNFLNGCARNDYLLPLIYWHWLGECAFRSVLLFITSFISVFGVRENAVFSRSGFLPGVCISFIFTRFMEW